MMRGSVGRMLALQVSLAAIATVCGCAAPSAVVGPAGGRYWRPAVSGDVFITDNGAPGSATEIDVEDDLELGAANVPELTAAVAIARHTFTIDYLALTFDGEATPPADLIFEGVTFPAGTLVQTDLTGQVLRATYEFDLVGTKKFKLRTGLAGYYVGIEGQLKGSVGGVSYAEESESIDVAFPTLVLSAEFGLHPRVLLTGRACGVGISGSNYALDLDACAELAVLKHLYVTGGYRFQHLRLDIEDNEADLRIQGPALGMLLRF